MKILSGKGYMLLLGCGAVAVALVLALYFSSRNQDYFDNKLLLDAPFEYQVQAGNGVTTTIARLARLGLIQTPPPAALLRLQLKTQQLDFGIQRGDYLLEPGMSLRQALELFRAGKIAQQRWILVEGQTLVQALPSLAANASVDYDLPRIDGFDDYPELARALDLPDQNPEGLFLANTYFFPRNTRASEVLALAQIELARVQRQMTPACEKLAAEGFTRLSAYQQLIFASIIEKETGLASERTKIAAVFHNRLTRGMRLQTDPTVIYGLGDSYKGNITRKHLTSYTPYNTYLIEGLPPTPISNVGEDSLRAVCHPDPDFIATGMLFFVGKGDGSHHFSATYAEHQQAVARYQLKRKKNYRSSPVTNPANSNGQ